MKLDKVVAGVDGSAHGRAAVEWAAGLAGLTGAEVIAVHAVGLLEKLDPAFTATDHHSIEAHRERLEREWLQGLPAGAPVRFVVRESNAVLALLAVVEEEAADLIVVGTRGSGGRLDARLGSTSAAVVERAPCPVVVIPPGTPTD